MTELKLQRSNIHGNNRMLTVEVVYGNDSVRFTTATYQNTRYANVDALFTPINNFLVRLTEESRAAIFLNMKNISRILEGTNNHQDASLLIAECVQQIYSQFEEDDIYYYITQTQTGMVIPDTIPYEHGNMPAETTFIREDYLRLLCLATAVQLMVPVWGAMISKFNKKYGSAFKESYIYAILSNTTVDNYKGTIKLRNFVMARTDKMPNSINVTLAGLASTQFADWLLALTITRKLCISELIGSGTDLATNIFTFVKGKVDKPGQTLKSFYNDKTSTEDNSEEGGLSLAENYKLSTRYTPATGPRIDSYSSRTHQLAARLNPQYDKRLLDACINNLLKPRFYPYSQFQIDLIKLFNVGKISEKALGLAEIDSQSRLLGIAQAWLFDHKLFHLGIMASARNYLEIDPEHEHVPQTEPRVPYPDELMTELNNVAIYQVGMSIKDYRETSAQTKKTNVITKRLQIISTEIYKTNFAYDLPEQLMRHFGVTSESVIDVDRKFIFDYANLILKFSQ